MATSINNILEEARKYIGVVGESAQHKYIIDTYNSVHPLPVGYLVKYHDDWCDAFISFLAIKTNATDIIGRECGVERHISIFKSLGIWNENGGVVPNKGDIITFNWDKSTQPNDGFADHIGIVEKVENGKIYTIEGNSNNSVRRREYTIADGRIRGYARPKYTESSGLVTLNPEYNGGDLVNAGKTLSQKNIQILIQQAKRYNLKPSFLIAQMFIESHWGHPSVSKVGNVDNNWSGISEPFNIPTSLGIKISRGSSRPANEGGYYVHFQTIDDYFKAYAYLLSEDNGLYNVFNKNTIEDFCKGLFKVGGAKYDYAASGYQHYYSLLIPTYNAIKRQNNGKLEQIDASNSVYSNSGLIEVDNNGFERIPETDVFYPKQTINIRNYPSRSGEIVGEYKQGDSFNYDSYVVNDGYIWLSYISYSGVRRYVAWRVQGGEKFGKIGKNTTTSSFTRIPETDVFYPNQTINIRNYPSRSGEIVGEYKQGDSFNYDSYVVNDGYIWLSYISYSGVRRYVAWRVQGGEKFGRIGTENKPTPNNRIESNGFTRIPESGTFYPNQTINIRNQPSRTGEKVGQYKQGDSFNYDSYVVNDGHIWLSYISYSGERRYVAWRVQNGEKFGVIR